MIDAFIKGFTSPIFWEMVGFMCAFLGAILIYAVSCISVFIIGEKLIKKFGK